MLNEDFKDMLSCFLEEHVEFLLIGAYALAAHGYPRATKDIDLWVKASAENAPRIMKSLSRFGAPMPQINIQDFITEGTVFQIGVAPRRYPHRMEIEIEGLKIPVISRQHLIENKEASGRPQDLVDAEMLKRQSS